VSPLASGAAKTVLRFSAVNRAMRTLARLRGHRLVLVYHRVGPAYAAGSAIVPSVSAEIFRAQLEALRDTVDLVSLDDILRDHHHAGTASRPRRPAVAVTFDDDLPSHTEEALPCLLQLGVTAAFFLSGRALHGRGPYWFQLLESLLMAYGGAHLAARLGVPGARPDDLAVACQTDEALRRRIRALASELPPCEILQPDQIAALAKAGMTVGFHTVDHDPMPGLDDSALDEVVTRGRDDLAAVIGTPPRYFAYPFGQADTRCAAAVRRAGFEAAFTGRPRPVRSSDDRHQLGRWEPGPLRVDDLLVALAIRLHRPSPSARSS
jgi:peptidoglycan/xylan/chitin deacetylase (PgdA/CDA1 family)